MVQQLLNNDVSAAMAVNELLALLVVQIKGILNLSFGKYVCYFRYFVKSKKIKKTKQFDY